MSGPAYHGRTHVAGGTDPIPGLGDDTPTYDSFVDQIVGHANLVHYWRMGAASGVQPDTSGHVGGAFDLTKITAGTAGTYDVVGALENGEDDGAWQQNIGGASVSDTFASATGHRANFSGTASFTVECWIWVDPAWTAAGGGGIVSNMTGGGSVNGWQLNMAPNSGRRLMLARHTTGTYSTTGMTAGVWHHIAGTYDGTTCRIYVDGELFFSEANAASVGVLTVPIRVGLGGGSANQYFWGKIDEVALYNTNLSAVDILAHATSGKPLGFGNTVKRVNAAYTMVTTDEIVLADGTFTVTLPSANGIPGQRYYVKNVGTGSITVSRAGTNVIDNALTTLTLAAQKSRLLVSDGQQWHILAAHLA